MMRRIWAVAMVGTAYAVFGFAACTSAIFRVQGEVVSVTDLGENGTKICISDAVDPDDPDRDDFEPRECRDGFLEGEVPTEGDCVVLQTQGESSMLEVTRASGC